MHYIAMQYNANMPRTAGPPLVHGEVKMTESRVVQVASALRRSRGLTTGEVARALAIPQPIAAEWLSLLEAGGLVRACNRWNVGRGAPLRIYRPCLALREVVSRNPDESRETFSFETLKGICKFQIDACCTISQAHLPCRTSSCPFIGLS